MSGGDLFFGRSSQGISAQQSSRDVGNRTATAHAHVPRGVLQSRPVPAPRFGNRTGPAKSSRHGPCGLLLDPWREGAERNADGDSLTCRYRSGAARTRAGAGERWRLRGRAFAGGGGPAAAPDQRGQRAKRRGRVSGHVRHLSAAGLRARLGLRGRRGGMPLPRFAVRPRWNRAAPPGLSNIPRYPVSADGRGNLIVQLA